MKKKRLIIYSLTAVVVIGLVGAFYGYREFNRLNESVTEMKPAFTLKAPEMIRAFETDEPAALQQYAGKVVQLEGLVKNVETIENGPTVVVMGDEKSTTSLRVEMDSLQVSGALMLEKGKNASLRAVCTGFSADDLGLGSDILLNRGVIVKN